MTRMTNDVDQGRAAAERGRLVSGLAFGLLSAAAFSLSGPIGTALMAAGWTPGAAVAVRVALGALVLAPLGVRSLRGRWGGLRQHAPMLLGYGVIGVAGTQLAYFYAVTRLDVGVALLIEYAAPVAVVGYLWLRHGERPGRLTTAGALVAVAGLVLVLDLTTGADLDPIGVAWALLAMACVAVYFVMSAQPRDLPPAAMATGGLVVGTVVLVGLGAFGIMPMSTSTDPVGFRDTAVSWWLPVAALGVVTAATAFGSGIAAGRRLGSRVASFVGLAEVLGAVVFAWLLLGQAPGPMQYAGGALVLAGVVLVRLGERAPR